MSDKLDNLIKLSSEGLIDPESEFDENFNIVTGQLSVGIKVGVALGVENGEVPYNSDFGISDLLFYTRGNVIENEIRERLSLVGVKVTQLEFTNRGYAVNGILFK